MNISDIITTTHLEWYLTAYYGDELAVFPDGHVAIIDGSISFRDDGPIARARCPGIGNLDSSFFTEGFARKRLSDEGDWDGLYETLPGSIRVVDGYHVVDDSGRIVGDLAAVIMECCRDGDMSGFMDDLIARLEESMESMA